MENSLPSNTAECSAADVNPSQPKNLQPITLLRLPDVRARVGLSRASIYEMIHQEQFPAPIRLTPTGRAVAWIGEEIDRWVEERVAASRASFSIKEKEGRGHESC